MCSRLCRRRGSDRPGALVADLAMSAVQSNAVPTTQLPPSSTRHAMHSALHQPSSELDYLPDNSGLEEFDVEDGEARLSSPPARVRSFAGESRLFSVIEQYEPCDGPDASGADTARRLRATASPLEGRRQNSASAASDGEARVRRRPGRHPQRNPGWHRGAASAAGAAGCRRARSSGGARSGASCSGRDALAGAGRAERSQQ